MTVLSPAPFPSQLAEKASLLRSAGFLPVAGALEAPVVARLAAALDRVYEEEVARGRTGAGEPMHLLGEIGRVDAFLDLLDHPAVFPVIWGELGWNIHLYHCHLDVTPPHSVPRHRAAWGWHQDGGRQNLELETDPRPRMSLKVAFWLSDVSVPGRGNLLIVPGSHESNTLPRPDHPELGFDPPAGATPVLACPGDALVFDRRLWHSRSDNLSEHTRRVVFLPTAFAGSGPATSSASTRRASASVAFLRCAGSCWASPPAATTNGDWSARPCRCTQNSIDEAYWILPCQANADTKCGGPTSTTLPVRGPTLPLGAKSGSVRSDKRVPNLGRFRDLAPRS